MKAAARAFQGVRGASPNIIAQRPVNWGQRLMLIQRYRSTSDALFEYARSTTKTEPKAQAVSSGSEAKLNEKKHPCAT